MKALVSVLLLLLAGPALSETRYPWEGVWAYDPAACGKTEGEILPFTLTATEVQSIDAPCDIVGLTAVPGMAAWSFTMSCAADGDVIEEPHLLMMDGPDVIWQWFGSDEPLRFQRCPK